MAAPGLEQRAAGSFNFSIFLFSDFFALFLSQSSYARLIGRRAGRQKYSRLPKNARQFDGAARLPSELVRPEYEHCICATLPAQAGIPVALRSVRLLGSLSRVQQVLDKLEGANEDQAVGISFLVLVRAR